MTIIGAIRATVIRIHRVAATAARWTSLVPFLFTRHHDAIEGFLGSILRNEILLLLLTHTVVVAIRTFVLSIHREAGTPTIMTGFDTLRGISSINLSLAT